MQTLNLAAEDPLSLTLSADARLADTDYADDQTWELTLGGGEPAALALQTTFGLRAHWLRLFPRFVRAESTRADSSRTDPARFHQTPRVTRFYPNYIAVTFRPFDGLDVLAEYWAAGSKIITGRLRLSNVSILPINFRLEWAALLNPLDRMGGMITAQAGPSAILEGETAYLHPVVAMTGGPQAGSVPYPSLNLDLELMPGISRQISWAAASMRSREESLEAARNMLARSWEAELTRVELLNFSQSVEITTGRDDWDAALALSQKTAFGLLMNGSSPDLSLPHTSFVLSRRPDHGFSPRGDGGDYPYSWTGQTALDSWTLASLLPGAPEITAGLVRNFLSVQDESGFIDSKPGLGGQRSQFMAQPLLATLALQAAAEEQRVEWYREVFPSLLRFFDAWFDTRFDADGDGFPEWTHPLQTGLEDSPIFDRWSEGAQGINAPEIESPALAAMLLRECRSLIEMGRAIVKADEAAAAYARLTGAEPVDTTGAAAALPRLQERETALLGLIESTWDEQAKIYRYRDYQTHLSLPGRKLTEFNGPRRFNFSRRFRQPVRLLVHLRVSEERTFAAEVTIHGYAREGEGVVEISETLTPRSFSWVGKQARAATQNAFIAVRRVEARGLTKADWTRIFTADYTQEDCSLLLPLWAGAPSEDRARVLVEETLEPRYLRAYGIITCPEDGDTAVSGSNSGGETAGGEAVAAVDDREAVNDSEAVADREAVAAAANPAASASDGGGEAAGGGETAGDQITVPAEPVNHARRAALLPWNLMIGEGLLRYGYRDTAAALVTRLMDAAARSLKEHQSFRQYTAAETGQAAGERGHLHGLAPLGLFLRVIGIREFEPRSVLIDGFNPFPTIININYRKIRITCRPNETEIRFPGGQAVTIDSPGVHRVTLNQGG